MRKVCSISGKPPTALCPSVKYEWAIEGVTKTFPCDMHKIKSGKTILNLPSEFGEKNFDNKKNNNNKILTQKKYSELNIISPVPGASYFLAPFDKERKIPMKTEGALKYVWWYLDGEYIGSSSPENTFFHSVPDGEHLISAVDSEGRSSFVNLKVLTPGLNNNSNKNSQSYSERLF